jgi:LacI family transcriptional regulator
MVCNPTRPSVLVACSVFADACHRGVARFAREHDWHVVADMKFSGAFPRGWRGDGIVALPGFDSQLARYIVESGVPTVAIATTGESLPFRCVAPHDESIGVLAADHLLDRAYRHFAYAPFSNDAAQAARHVAFEQRLRESGRRCGVLPSAHRRVGEFWRDDWVEYWRNLESGIRALPRPVGILAGNDAVAADIVEICRGLGLSVPEEVAVIGVGNEATICESAAVPLSSVELDVEGLAFAAAQLLKQTLDGVALGSGNLRIRAGGVVTRLSTDACAVKDPRVARALNYIAEHYSDARLSVADVSSAVGLSRRQLERSFRQVTGLTLSEHIVRRRMQEASRLLRTHTRAKITDVAELVGFSDLRTFFRTFRKHFGESPNLHRRPGQPAESLSVAG